MGEKNGPQAGTRAKFRLFRALLEAPSDLRCLLLFARDLRSAIEVIPPTWNLVEDFSALKKAAIWIEAISNGLRNCNTRAHVPTNDESREPVDPYVSTTPFYATMCHTHKVRGCEGIYPSYVERYSAHVGFPAGALAHGRHLPGLDRDGRLGLCPSGFPDRARRWDVKKELSWKASVEWKQRVSARFGRARSAVAAKGSLRERHK